MGRWGTLFGCGVAFLATAAAAEDSNADRLCSERPGLTTSACITAPGRLQTETALADWTLDRSQGERDDSVLIGDTLVRYGVGGKTEIRFGWTPFGIDRDRAADGSVEHAHRVGDATVGVKTSLVERKSDNGLAVSMIATASLPVGRQPIGAGDWGFSFLLPITYRTSKTVSIQATPMAAAAVDDDGRGRHARYGSAVEIEYALSDAVKTDVSAQILRDDDPDPSVRGTPALASVALSWQPSHNTQLDLGTNVGLNRAAPDAEVYAGISHRF
ncbi:transporter [Sphingomonas morindae]|uniref:Transporter n=1 Tax=Sphingomonas morindae TaxID=1541170 RepID=A0ABY4X483_9SPHN|nr:transporter [Sphingomonas morindae]USI71689.1 transporter [Sphingomonas morindae]